MYNIYIVYATNSGSVQQTNKKKTEYIIIIIIIYTPSGKRIYMCGFKKKPRNVHDKICIYMRNVVIICALKICSFKFKIFMGRSVL